MDNYYFQKYLKYKKRYLELKGGQIFGKKKKKEEDKKKYILEIKKLKQQDEQKPEQQDEQKINQKTKITDLKKIIFSDDCVVHEGWKQDKHNKCNLVSYNDFNDILVNNFKNATSYNNPHIKKLIVNDNDKIIIIGDLHCNLKALCDILSDLYDKYILNDDMIFIKDNYHIVFLGDMIDRGYYGSEVLFLILLLKNKNNEKIHIIGGNHENESVYTRYGFSDELDNELGNELENEYDFTNINKLFKSFPCAIFVKFDNDDKFFQLCHGGIDKNYYNIKELLSDKIPIHILEKSDFDTTGFTWTDFDYDVKKYKINTDRTLKEEKKFKNPLEKKQPIETKQPIYTIGVDYTEEYLKNNNIYSIISGHQDKTSIAILKKTSISILKKIINEKKNKNKSYNLYNVNNEILDPVNDFLALVTSNAVKNQIDDEEKNPLYLILNVDQNKKKILL